MDREYKILGRKYSNGKRNIKIQPTKVSDTNTLSKTKKNVRGFIGGLIGYKLKLKCSSEMSSQQNAPYLLPSFSERWRNN